MTAKLKMEPNFLRKPYSPSVGLIHSTFSSSIQSEV